VFVFLIVIVVISVDCAQGQKKVVRDLQEIQKKIEAGEDYFTRDELDAIWWDGYEHGSIDSAYDMYDKGYVTAIDDYNSAWGRYNQRNP
jgi:hypothetical protein